MLSFGCHNSCAAESFFFFFFLFFFVFFFFCSQLTRVLQHSLKARACKFPDFRNGLVHVCLYRVETKSSRLSVKLSNANPVSTWISECLTQLGVVDILCIFFFFFCACSVFFFFFFFFSSFCHSAISLFVFVLQTPFPILWHVSDMSLL